jgi:hypothetical protein
MSVNDLRRAAPLLAPLPAASPMRSQPRALSALGTFQAGKDLPQGGIFTVGCVFSPMIIERLITQEANE